MRRRIGGGLLIAVSAAVPVIVDKMAIQLSTEEGAILLAICVIVALIGLALVFWPDEKTPSARAPSTTAHASGGGQIDLEDAYSTADTFAHVEEGSSVVAKRIVHDPVRGDDKTGGNRDADRDDPRLSGQ